MPLTLLLALLSWRLPALLYGQTPPFIPVLALTFLPIVVDLFARLVIIRRPLRVSPSGTLWGGTFVALFAIASARSDLISGGALIITLAQLTVMLYCAAIMAGMTRERALNDLYHAMGAFVLINLVLRFGLGMSGSGVVLYEQYGAATLLSSLGVGSTRVLFPLAGGLNNFAVTAGLVLAASLYQLVSRTAANQWVTVMYALGAFTACLFVDSRAALALAAVPAALAWMASWRRINVKPFVATAACAVALLIPWLYVAVGQLLGGLTWLQSFARNPDDLTTLSNRAYIWSDTTAYLLEHSSEALVGWGAYGQTLTGVVYMYANRLSSFANIEFTSVHNSLLQLVYDMGVLGTGGVLLVLYRTIASSRGMEFALALYIVLAGITEATIGPFNLEVLLVMTVLTTLTGIARTHWREQPSALPTA